MKRKHMYPLVLFIIIQAFFLTSFAQTLVQKDNLVIVKQKADQEDNSVLIYPKGSRFQLKNDAGRVIASTEDVQESYRYQGSGQLLVFPTYREGADQFPFKQELINIFTSKEALDESGLLSKTPEENIPSTKEAEEEAPLLSETGAYIGKVQAKKQVFPSTFEPGKLNLILSFNNGIVFTYIDGVAQAQLGEEKLAIKGNYIVSSPKGTAKISFNPSSGEVWYYFEPRD